MREPSHAERAKTLVWGGRVGLLSTIARRPAGHPFGSLAAYAPDPAGRPILCLSDLAEHARNLAADPRASLLVAEGGDDPLAAGRVTLVGEARPADDPSLRERFRAAHPQAAYLELADFKVYLLEVAEVRYVGGFGQMSWVGAADYLAAEPDPVAAFADRVIEHMNADHADALAAYARAFGGLEAGSVRLVAVDRYGFEVEASGQRVRVPFGIDARTPAEVRSEMIRLADEARARLASG